MKRLAIIGLGAVTRNIHLPAYRKLANKVEIVAGCDTDETTRTEMQRHLPSLFADPAEMIGRTEPDIVAVCTPPSSHMDLCLLALKEGCHVFCEKPMAETIADATAIIRASETHGRHVVINTQFPFMETYQSAKQMIGTPAFGRLLFMHAAQTFQRSEETETGWRGRMQRRLCFEFGVHVFELTRFFFDDEPSSIYAHMPNPLRGYSSDVVNTIALEFSDGRAAAIVLDRLSAGPHRYLDLTLDGEFASIFTSIGGELRLEVGVRTETRRPYISWQLVKGGKSVLQQGEKSSTLAKEGFNPFATATARHLEQFLTCLKNGDTPRATAQDHVHTLALAFAAYESAETRQVIDMKEYLARNTSTRVR